MGIIAFRAHKAKMLNRQAPEIRDTINYRIEYVLDLLGTDTMSVEGLALLVSQVSFETKTLDPSKLIVED